MRTQVWQYISSFSTTLVCRSKLTPTSSLHTYTLLPVMKCIKKCRHHNYPSLNISGYLPKYKSIFFHSYKTWSHINNKSSTSSSNQWYVPFCPKMSFVLSLSQSWSNLNHTVLHLTVIFLKFLLSLKSLLQCYSTNWPVNC